MAGKVYLVGAGPGAPDLITIRAIEVLKEAEVVFYDRLVHPSILEYAEKAKLVYCGKEPGRHVWNQEEINQALVSEALQGKTVVRLKGGDPFVFGRGGEEALALEKAGVPFEIIPGVSSAIGVPGVLGIPLTQRGVSSSVAIVTGRQDPTCPSKPIDWDAISRMETVVILMGVKELPRIVEELLRRKTPGTPVAVIYHGTYPNQKIVKGSLEDIVERCGKAGIKPPAVIVIGQVVKFIEKFSMLDYFPLYGIKVEIIGSFEEVRSWSEYFYNSGAEVRKTSYQKSFSREFLNTLQRLNCYKLLFFYDSEAIEGFFSALKEKEIDIRDLKGTRFGVFDEKFASELRKHDIFSGIEVFENGPPEDSINFASSPLKEAGNAISLYEIQVLVKESGLRNDKYGEEYKILLSPSALRLTKKLDRTKLLASSKCRPLLRLQQIPTGFYFESFSEIVNFIKEEQKTTVAVRSSRMFG